MTQTRRQTRGEPKTAGATWADVVVRRVFTVDVDKLQAAYLTLPLPLKGGEGF